MFTIGNCFAFTFANMNPFLKHQSELKSQTLQGRYITYQKIEAFLKDFDQTEVGASKNGTPISAIKIGNGPIKILMWSQMHGNESTSTKGIMDVFYFLKSHSTLLKPFTIQLLPMLNPDGALAYSRANANDVDLNRDATQHSQPETKALFEVYDTFQPHYCFNLHDQRTIFGVKNHPCMLSYLAPAADADKSITAARKLAMGVVGYINKVLQQYIPNHVGRYDDTYNPNCVGDCFQSKGTPTILFECGQSGQDYGRQLTRKWFSVSVLGALNCIANNLHQYAVYKNIPEVEKSYVDILIHNIPSDNTQISMAFQYEEKLTAGKISFVPILHKKGDLSHLNAYKIIDLIKYKNINYNLSYDDTGAKKLLKMLDLTHYSH